MRATWTGLPTIYKEQYQESANPCLNTVIESPELVISHLDVQAGFTLTDPRDPRYQFILSARRRFGEVSQRASSALRENTGGEDHTDAVISVTRAIDTYLLGYGLSRSDFYSIQKNYTHAREYVLNSSPGMKKATNILVLQWGPYMAAAERTFKIGLCETRTCVPQWSSVYAFLISSPIGA